MNQQILIVLSEGLLLAAASVGIIMILVASYYDFRAVAQQRKLRKVVAALRKPKQPHVTVLVYAKNDSSTITTCLRSIARSRYKHFDVVVVDNVSQDATGHLVGEHIQKHPLGSLYYYKKRKTFNRLLALQQAYKKSKQGELVLVIDAKSTISPTLIKECVARFMVDTSLGTLYLNRRPADVRDLATLTAYFLQLSRNVYSKFISLIGPRYVWQGETGVMYLSRGLRTRIVTPRLKQYTSRYAGQLVISVLDRAHLFAPDKTPGVGRSILLLPVVLFAGYFMVTAATLQSSTLLVLSWLIVSIWIFFAVISDEASRIGEKMTLLFCLPVAYFLVYTQGVFYIAASLKGFMYTRMKVWRYLVVQKVSEQNL